MRHFLAVIVLVLPLRALVLWALSDDLNKDVDGYRALAVNLRQQGTLGWGDPARPEGIQPSAYRPPLYPLLLAPLVTGLKAPPLATGLLHLALGAFTVGLVYATALRWGLRAWSWLAALLAAVDPILLHQSAQVMTETLAAFLAITVLFLLTRLGERPEPLRAAWAGAAMGLCVLARPTFLPWLAFCLLALLMSQRFRASRLQLVGWMLAAAAAVLMPWCARNFYQFGRCKLTTTHGGYTFLLANNPDFYRYLSEGAWGTAWMSEKLDEAWEYRHLARDPQDARWNDFSQFLAGSPSPVKGGLEDEFADDRLAYALGVRYAREQPGAFAYSCLVRIGRLWGILPHSLGELESPTRRVLRYGIAVWYAGLFVLSLIGLWKLGRTALRWPWVCGLLLCLAFTLVHAFYWTDLRMRAPLMPFLAIAAAAGAKMTSASFLANGAR